jgi:hypothetical protein
MGHSEVVMLRLSHHWKPKIAMKGAIAAMPIKMKIEFMSQPKPRALSSHTTSKVVSQKRSPASPSPPLLKPLPNV